MTSSRLAVRSRSRAQVPLVRIGLLAVAAVIAGVLIGTRVPLRAAAARWRSRSRCRVPACACCRPPAGRAATRRRSRASSARCGCATPARACAPRSALLPADSPTLLPKALSANAWQPETVRLRSGYEVWRYRVETLAGSAGFVYAAPTTGGVATVACLGASGAQALRRAGVGDGRARHAPARAQRTCRVLQRAAAGGRRAARGARQGPAGARQGEQPDRPGSRRR